MQETQIVTYPDGHREDRMAERYRIASPHAEGADYFEAVVPCEDGVWWYMPSGNGDWNAITPVPIHSPKPGLIERLLSRFI